MRPAAAVPYAPSRPGNPVRPRAVTAARAPARSGGGAVRVLAVAAAALGLLLYAPPAAASPPGPAAGSVAVPGAGAAESRTAAAPAPVTTLPHCSLLAGDGQKARCFATFREAVAFGTGGRVTDAPLSAIAAATDPAFTAAVQAPALTAANYLLGYEWADLNWTGTSLGLYGSGRCDDSADADFRFPAMPAGWNDRVSSFKSYNNCAQQLFRGTSFSGGALTSIVANMSYVGASANDQASSVTFN
jgi:hypothetical protein